MAAKRDALPPFSDSVLAKESLLHWYESIYSQFSSVSHYDRYSIELLGIQPAPDGTLVFAGQPHWPKLPLPARRRSGKRPRAAGREVTDRAPVQSTRGRGSCSCGEATVSTHGVAIVAKMRRLSRNRRKYVPAPAAAPRCPSKPSAASQACCIAIS